MNDTERAGVNELVNKLNIKEERIVDLEKENAELEKQLEAAKKEIADIIEAFTSRSYNDDFEMAQAGKVFKAEL